MKLSAFDGCPYSGVPLFLFYFVLFFLFIVFIWLSIEQSLKPVLLKIEELFFLEINEAFRFIRVSVEWALLFSQFFFLKLASISLIFFLSILISFSFLCLSFPVFLFPLNAPFLSNHGPCKGRTIRKVQKKIHAREN